MSGRPPISCSVFCLADFMRVPAPAAKTTMAQSVVSATSFFVLLWLGLRGVLPHILTPGCALGASDGKNAVFYSETSRNMRARQAPTQPNAARKSNAAVGPASEITAEIPPTMSKMAPIMVLAAPT